jgi:hypothetical protein
MKANLLLHCGSHAVDCTQLAAIETPEATTSWQPLPHITFVDAVRDVLVDHGIRIDTEAHGVTHDGHRYFGLMQISNGCVHDDYVRVLGLRNSHDKRLPVGLCAGTSVMVCDNLSFRGDEVQVSRKHTSMLLRDLPQLTDRAVLLLKQNWQALDERIEAYRAKRLRDSHAHDLVIRMLDAGAFCASKIPAVLGDWREPRYRAFKPRNVWSLFNAVTETVKGNLAALPKRTRALHRVCDEYVG